MLNLLNLVTPYMLLEIKRSTDTEFDVLNSNPQNGRECIFAAYTVDYLVSDDYKGDHMISVHNSFTSYNLCIIFMVILCINAFYFGIGKTNFSSFVVFY